MDSSTVSIAVGKSGVKGLTVETFSPELFIVLIAVIALGIVAFKFGPKLVIRRKTSCMSCMRVISMLNDSYRSRINALKDSILRDQLNYADLVFSSIELKIISSYKKNLDVLKVDPVKQKDEMMVYKSFLHNEAHKLISFIRLRLKSNHLSQYTKEQFKTYSAEVVSKIISETRLNMAEKWSSLFSVSVEMNKIEIDLLVPSIIIDVTSILTFAWETASKREAEIAEVEKQFDKELKDIVNESRTGKL